LLLQFGLEASLEQPGKLKIYVCSRARNQQDKNYKKLWVFFANYTELGFLAEFVIILFLTRQDGMKEKVGTKIKND